jgi:hypothetical protein
MCVTRLVCVLLLFTIALAPSVALAQQTAPDEPAMWRAVVARLPPASLVSVRLTDRTRLTGTVLRVDEETFTLKPRTRIPVPARELRFEEIAVLEAAKPSMSPGKKVLLGVGIGAAAYALITAVILAAVGYD